MATSDLIAHGFGSWGSVNQIPTLGFEIGEATAILVPRHRAVLMRNSRGGGVMAVVTRERIAGDTRTPIGAILKQRNSSGTLTPVDLSGKTLKFHMVKANGTVVVDEASATITDATGGEVQYDPEASEVTAGVYYAWFIVVDGSGEEDTFPVGGRKFQIIIRDAA